jgi:glycolate oxidase FAD binding subunit
VRTVEPATADEVAAVLADASSAGERVLVRGGGTKADLTSRRPASAAGLLLRTHRLSRIVAHRDGDLTATIEAGAVLDEVNQALRRRGQWLPLDPPWSDRATIGGIVAANDAGPRRHGYGSPRDLIIGVEIVRADGVRAKAGGIVVKNVAGYDLARLMAGSFGCLAVIVGVTFKLYPVTAASATVVADLPTHAAAGGLALAVNASQLTPTAVELQLPPVRMLIRFESIEASVAQQSAQAVRLVQDCGGRAAVVRGTDEQAEWDAHRRRPWTADGAVMKMTMLPSDLAVSLDRLAAEAKGCEVEVVGRASLGVLLARIGGSTQQQASVVRALREGAGHAATGRGAVTLLRASDELEDAVGVWGAMGAAFRVMQAVKEEFDPKGILNPGGGPGGL